MTQVYSDRFARRRIYREAPIVERRPSCPDCGSKERRTNGQHRTADGATVRYVQCLDCGSKYKTIEEA